MTQVEPAPGEAVSKHWIGAWCEEDDVPRSRLQDVTDVDVAFAIAAASNLLYVLSGRQYRAGRSVGRPTAVNSGWNYQSSLYPYSSMSGYGAAWGFAAGWAWAAIGMGWWQIGQDAAEMRLQGPIRRINNIMIDGTSLGPWPPSNPNYTVYDRMRVVLNVAGALGITAWPWEQNLQLGLDQPGTSLVDYEWGKSPPPAGKLAAIALTIELALSISGSDDCRLPDRVTSVATEGITTQVGDALQYVREELTGIPAVDIFLRAVNPAKLRRRSIFIGPNSTQTRSMEQFPLP